MGLYVSRPLVLGERTFTAGGGVPSTCEGCGPLPWGVRFTSVGVRGMDPPLGGGGGGSHHFTV